MTTSTLYVLPLDCLASIKTLGVPTANRLSCFCYCQQLWTDAKAVDFIAREYPWFLETFKGYEYPIQRADTIRYFVLAHYGGIYIDLDDVRSSMSHLFFMTLSRK